VARRPKAQPESGKPHDQQPNHVLLFQALPLIWCILRVLKLFTPACELARRIPGSKKTWQTVVNHDKACQINGVCVMLQGLGVLAARAVPVVAIAFERN
jgi:hypothetical protein